MLKDKQACARVVIDDCTCKIMYAHRGTSMEVSMKIVDEIKKVCEDCEVKSQFFKASGVGCCSNADRK